ncbi:hypothetical protein ACRAWC_03885 [Leifsonia sp. L25]
MTDTLEQDPIGSEDVEDTTGVDGTDAFGDRPSGALPARRAPRSSPC